MPRLGILSRFYVNLNTPASPNWSELPLISDCVVNGAWDEGDASSRVSRVKASEPTLMGLEITGKVRVQYANLNAAYIKMRDCYTRDLPFEVLALNGALTEDASEGFAFLAKVFNWSEDQSLGNVLFKDFSIKPCVYGASGELPPRAVRINGTTYTTYGIGQG